MAPRVLRHHFYAAQGSNFGLKFLCSFGGSGAASTFLPGFFMGLRNTCFFLIVLFLTSSDSMLCNLILPMQHSTVIGYADAN
jgi:hypothetical protein